MKIQVKDINKRFRRHEVLSHVSLNMESGKVYGFCGYNGSGKTMLMRAICGLLNLDSGSIIIDGKEMKKDFDFPESMGFLIENPAFLDEYSGFKNLHFITGIRNKVGDERIREILLKVGLNPDDKRKYKKYSLGMKQRLGIAAAIIEEPKLLVLDEPTNALDTEGVRMVKSIIKEEKEKGTLVILACHDKLFLDEVSDVFIEIEYGKIKSIERNLKNEER